MVIFKSVVVLDLETTSLPQWDHNTTKITELACIGCEIEHLRNSKELPRVLHKLVLLFNPNKLISPAASDITGLTNELLMNVKPFREEDVELLREFIGRLPSPVCLVAQNGDAFDFPILRRAMVKVNKELQNNVYCLDSLKAFRALLSPPDPPSGAVSKKRISPPTTPVPLKRTVPVNALRHKNVSKELQNASRELKNVSKELQNASRELKNVSRELFPDDDGLSEWLSSQEDAEAASQRPSQSPARFRLGDIYKFFFGAHIPEAHRAEGDANALLGCILRCQGFLEWMNENAVVFNSVQHLF